MESETLVTEPTPPPMSFYMQLKRAWYYGEPNVVELLKLREAAIRKDCADKAEAWYLQGVPELSRAEYAEEVASLRAAIMGDEHE